MQDLNYCARPTIKLSAILNLNWYGPAVLSELQWTKKTHDNILPQLKVKLRVKQKMSQE